MRTINEYINIFAVLLSISFFGIIIFIIPKNEMTVMNILSIATACINPSVWSFSYKRGVRKTVKNMGVSPINSLLDRIDFIDTNFYYIDNASSLDYFYYLDKLLVMKISRFMYKKDERLFNELIENYTTSVDQAVKINVNKKNNQQADDWKNDSATMQAYSNLIMLKNFLITYLKKQ